MIIQGGGVGKIFSPILQFQLIMNFYWPTHLGYGDFIFCKISIKTTIFSLRSCDDDFYALKKFL